MVDLDVTVPNCLICGDPVQWGFETDAVWVPDEPMTINSFQDMIDNGTFFHGSCREQSLEVK